MHAPGRHRPRGRCRRDPGRRSRSRRATTSTTRSNNCARWIRTRARRASRSRSGAGWRPGSPTCSRCTRPRCSRVSTRSASRARVGPDRRVSTPCVTSAECPCGRGAMAAGAKSDRAATRSCSSPIRSADATVRVVTGSTLLLVDAFPNVPRLSVQLGEPPRRTRFRRRFGDEGEWGARAGRGLGSARRFARLCRIRRGRPHRGRRGHGARSRDGPLGRRDRPGRQAARRPGSGRAASSPCRSSPSWRSGACAPPSSKAYRSPEPPDASHEAAGGRAMKKTCS